VKYTPSLALAVAPQHPRLAAYFRFDRNQFCSRLLVDPRPAAVSTVSRHMSAGRRTLSGLWTSLFAFRNQYGIIFILCKVTGHGGENTAFKSPSSVVSI
jgi:hypothetical protein